MEDRRQTERISQQFVFPPLMEHMVGLFLMFQEGLNGNCNK